jgi:hypothetical protein
MSTRRNGRKRYAGPKVSLDLYAFSDEELLAIVRDNLDSSGWVTSGELADAIGIDPDAETRNNAVGIRLAWMARFGVIRKNTPGDNLPGPQARWTITGRGIVILEATFSKSLEKELEGLKGEALWRLARTVTSRYGAADNESAVMVRRSFQRAHKQRSSQ